MSEPTIFAAEPKGFCRNCGKPLTADSLREVRGAYYCEDCLAQSVARPAAPVADGSPTLAAVLGFIPGLGAVYNGEYMKALVHVLIFGTIIVALDRTSAEGLFVPLLIAFIFYMPLEAYRTAKAKLMGRKPDSLFGEQAARLPVGPLILITAGFLLLVDRFVPRFLDRIFDFWPVVLIVVGVLLLLRRTGQPAGSGGTQHEQRN
jgi:hypothetical protein